VPSSRPVLIAGAGIGGLTAALAIAQRGFPVSVFEQAERLEEIGAGIQLSPNAARVLIALGLRERLERRAVAPQELRVMGARGARVLARAPLAAGAAQGDAPYWMIHRGDLQAALLEAVRADAAITLHLGARIDDFALDGDGVTVSAAGGRRGCALIAADGLWSRLRARLGHRDEPRFARRVAWRALIAADTVAQDARAPAVTLWFDGDNHLVHYPVRGGDLINVVAIVGDDWREAGWNAPGERAEILARYGAATWPPAARTVLAAAPQWHKWALYDRLPIGEASADTGTAWGHGAVTLLGDAAHPMLPYLAQGAAMAIEDAWVLARALAERRDDAPAALRNYERARHARTARVQHAAHRTGTVYHLGGGAALLRRLALAAMGGQRLIARYDWIYGWTPA
jgi:2-polyprenyl-6-methoxyphenol hydroxylase-like FAD-dependent oxidoreductase